MPRHIVLGSLRRLLLLGLGLSGGFGLSACDRGRPDREELENFSPGPVPVEFADEEKLFNRSCAGCHGQQAVGTAHGPPLVHRYYEPSHHADIAFQRAVTFGVAPHHWNFGPMPKIDGVSEADIHAITAYVRWLQRQAGIY